MTESQRNSLRSLAVSSEGSSDYVTAIASNWAEMHDTLNKSFAKQSPEIVRLVAALERTKDVMIQSALLLRTVAALAQAAADSGD